MHLFEREPADPQFGFAFAHANAPDSVPDLISAISAHCNIEPYIVCDPESFDDETYMFFTPEDAQAKAGELAGGKAKE